MSVAYGSSSSSSLNVVAVEVVAVVAVAAATKATVAVEPSTVITIETGRSVQLRARWHPRLPKVWPTARN